MQIFGRRPRQKRGSRCLVLLSPLLLLFIVLLVLTIVRYRQYDAAAKIANACITGAAGIACILGAVWLYRRTRRFYALAASESWTCAALIEAPSRYGKDVCIEFFAAKAEDVRAFLAADGAGELFSADAALDEKQRDKLLDAYFALADKLGKSYSYQEFIPLDLQFLRKKTIFICRRLYSVLSPALCEGQLAQGENEIAVYDPEKEWAQLREQWLQTEAT